LIDLIFFLDIQVFPALTEIELVGLSLLAELHVQRKFKTKTLTSITTTYFYTLR